MAGPQRLPAAAAAKRPEVPAPLASAAPTAERAVPAGDFSRRPTAPTELAGAKAVDDLVEVADKPAGGVLVAQDESTDVWALPDGSRVARLHGGAVNVRSRSGQWQRLDARWEVKGGRLRPVVSPLGVSVAEVVGEGRLVELAGEGWSAGFDLEWPAGPPGCGRR